MIAAIVCLFKGHAPICARAWRRCRPHYTIVYRKCSRCGALLSCQMPLRAYQERFPD